MRHRTVTPARCAISVLLACAVVLAGCTSDDDSSAPTTTDAAETTTTPESVITTAAASGDDIVTCTDPSGDTQAMRGLEATPSALSSADVTSVSVELADDSMSVTFEMEGPAVLTEGNRGLELKIDPIDDQYPAAEVRVAQTTGGEDDVSITVWSAQSDINEVDASTMVTLLDGRTVTVVVPVDLLAPALDGAWHWSATITAAGVDAMAQDACGSTEAGAGSRIEFFDAPSAAV